MASINGGSARSGRPAAVAARPSRSRIAARSAGSALTSFAWVRNEIGLLVGAERGGPVGGPDQGEAGLDRQGVGLGPSGRAW